MGEMGALDVSLVATLGLIRPVQPQYPWAPSLGHRDRMWMIGERPVARRKRFVVCSGDVEGMVAPRRIAVSTKFFQRISKGWIDQEIRTGYQIQEGLLLQTICFVGFSCIYCSSSSKISFRGTRIVTICAVSLSPRQIVGKGRQCG